MPGPDSTLDPATARRLLGLEPTADAATLARAFASAVKAAHPDRPGGDGERLRVVIEARRTLRAVALVDGRADQTRYPRLTISPGQAMRGGWSSFHLGERCVRVRLPPGLRAGDLVRVAGESLRVASVRRGGAFVAGDDVIVTARVTVRVLSEGGRLGISTPVGATACWISAADAARGFVRLRGRGLPARGGRPVGDLIVRLEAAADPAGESPARAKLRRFAAAWAA